MSIQYENYYKSESFCCKVFIENKVNKNMYETKYLHSF